MYWYCSQTLLHVYRERANLQRYKLHTFRQRQNKLADHSLNYQLDYYCYTHNDNTALSCGSWLLSCTTKQVAAAPSAYIVVRLQ